MEVIGRLGKVAGQTWGKMQYGFSRITNNTLNWEAGA